MDAHCYTYAKWLSERFARLKPEYRVMIDFLSWQALRKLADGIAQMQAAELEAQKLLEKVMA